MKQILEPLQTSALTNMEAGQLMNRHLSDLGTIDPNLMNDAPYNNYVLKISSKMEPFVKALAQVQKNEETLKIGLADDARDKAVSAIRMAIKLHGASDDPVEVEASRSLGILFGPYKNLEKLNYEAETMGIDKLLSDLTNPVYSEKVNYLQMNRYVVRLTNTNNAFKELFGGRMVTTAATESFDMKAIRKDLQATYNDFTAYVLSMAKATENPLFPTALNLLNTARKYYSDLLARRATPKPEEANPPVD
jgi:hypothetical protein